MTSSFFCHPNALVETGNIGEGTRIWAFAHVLPGAIIGKDCNICDHVFIENEVQIGDRVTVKCGVQVWDGVSLEDDVFVGPNVTFTNDRFPRSKKYLAHYPKTIIKQGASIGANATILPGLVIGRNAMVGAGSVVISDVPPNAIVVGNPARITGYANTQERRSVLSEQKKGLPSEQDIQVKGVKLYQLPEIEDLRGYLTFAEYDGVLPFTPKRFFLIYGVPSKEIRGEHAHKEQHQFLICVKGSLVVMVEDGSNRMEFVLDRPTLGLHVPPMVWATQYKYSSDAVLLVLASDVYDAKDYIRDYDEFLKRVG